MAETLLDKLYIPFNFISKRIGRENIITIENSDNIHHVLVNEFRFFQNTSISILISRNFRFILIILPAKIASSGNATDIKSPSQVAIAIHKVCKMKMGKPLFKFMLHP